MNFSGRPSGGSIEKADDDDDYEKSK